VPPSGAVKNGVFFDVEPDFGFGLGRRRLQQRTEFLEDFAQGDVVDQQRFVYHKL